MPSITLNNPEDKATVKRFLSSPNTRIITATVARLYIAYPDPSQWTYAGILGAVALIQTSNTFFLRIVDLLYGQGIVWEQELYQGFVYHQDMSFFHTFQADNYVAGFSFADEHEAEVFYSKVNGRARLRPFKPVASSGTLAKSAKAGGAQGRNKFPLHNGKLDKSRIGMPSDFRHVGHIGWDPDVGFEAQNIDPAWRTLFDQLDTFGVSRQQINENAVFITTFVNAHGGLAQKQPNGANSNNNRNGNNGDSLSDLSRIDSPPPLLGRAQSPPPPKKRPPPPPPPPVNTPSSNQGGAATAPLASPAPYHGYLPRPLAQVMASITQKQEPKQPLSINTNNTSQLSSPPASASASSSTAANANAIKSPVENSLLASIRESGGLQGLRKTGALRSPPPRSATTGGIGNRPSSPSMMMNSSNSQGDLVSALVAALHRRQTKLTYSEDEDGNGSESDDGWDADD
ncbi:hypothetical protein BGZ95_009968 [Linnemannia exigua]|uniref:WH1-domain-containing protein n=1 Tax=Linnemannia exigua TaxID=604196 RepID=A0AAD4H9J0_9FUNG|nr:hypothetical protein BGZ95_009968 [Linnemannia exigua]